MLKYREMTEADNEAVATLVRNTQGRSFCAKLSQNSLLQQAGVPWYNPYIITAYAPSPEKWEAYWKTRNEEIK